jgi:N-acetyl-anhydromuramoyl-L-alanine amidase
LIHELAVRYPIRDVAGHEHVAPGRKDDPGPGFEWARLRQATGRRGLRFPRS